MDYQCCLLGVCVIHVHVSIFLSIKNEHYSEMIGGTFAFFNWQLQRCKTSDNYLNSDFWSVIQAYFSIFFTQFGHNTDGFRLFTVFPLASLQLEN